MGIPRFRLRTLMTAVAVTEMTSWVYVEWGRLGTNDRILVLASLMGLVCPACILVVLATLILLGLVIADNVRAIWNPSGSHESR